MPRYSAAQPRASMACRLAARRAAGTVLPTMESNANRRYRRLANVGAAILVASFGVLSAVHAQDAASAAWRVECTGHANGLECRALEQVVNRDDKHLLPQLTLRLPPDSNAA